MSYHAHVPLLAGVMFFGAACSHMPAAPIAPAIPPEPIVVTKPIDVPVAVSCIEEKSIPPAPVPPAKPAVATLTPDFSGAWDGVSWLKGYIAILKQDDAKLRAALLACVVKTVPGGPAARP